MKAITFKEQNIVFSADQPEYSPLPALVLEDGTVITAWEFEENELKELIAQQQPNYDSLKLQVTMLTFGMPIQPISISLIPPQPRSEWVIKEELPKPIYHNSVELVISAIRGFKDLILAEYMTEAKREENSGFLTVTNATAKEAKVLRVTCTYNFKKHHTSLSITSGIGKQNLIDIVRDHSGVLSQELQELTNAVLGYKLLYWSITVGSGNGGNMYITTKPTQIPKRRGYGLYKCNYYTKTFPDLEELLKDVIETGGDPNYYIDYNGKKQPDKLSDLIQI